MDGSPDAELPAAYRTLTRRWGEPVGVERARRRWAELVAGARAGQVTLLVPGDAAAERWGALVPVAAAGALDGCPSWPLTEARNQLGRLVAGATVFPYARPHLLTRHGRPVAALVSALDLLDDGTAGVRLDADAVVADGGTVLLRPLPPAGAPAGPPGPPHEVLALATSSSGAVIGRGRGASVAEALQRLRSHPADTPRRAGAGGGESSRTRRQTQRSGEKR